MPSEKLPWCIRKRNADGTERWYWQRRGHKLRRLDSDPVKRLAEVRRLNAAADGRHQVEGSIGWCVAQYRGSPRYRALGASTRVAYDRWLAYFEAAFGADPAEGFTRKVVVRLRQKLVARHGLATVLHAFAVLRLVLDVAHDHDLIAHNPAQKPKLGAPPPRQAVWPQASIDAFLAAAPPPLALAFRLLLFTAQRPSDVVRMAWSQYDGAAITLRQRKTGALVAVRAHRDLRAALDQQRRRGPLIAVQGNGRAWTAGGLCEALRQAMRRAGLDTAALQVRDLRRTAVVRLAEAGCTIPEIAGVTGHSIKTAETIVAVYLPRTAQQAHNAILKLERKRP